MKRHTSTAPLVRSGNFLAALVLVVGLMATAVAGTLVLQSNHRNAVAAMDQRTLLVQRAAEAATHRHSDALKTIAGGLSGHGSLGRAEFEEAAKPVREMQLPGATAIAFIVSAQDRNVKQVQAQWRSQGADNLEFKPVGSGKDHFFTVFNYALDNQVAPVPGTDVSQAAAPTAALLEAQRRGTITVSDTYQLIRDSNLPVAQRQQSFVLSAPVYGPDGPGGEKNFAGWVLMGLRGQDFVGAALDEVAQGLTDVTLRASNADGTLVDVAKLRASAEGKRDLRRTFVLKVAQRSWTVDVAASSKQLPGGSHAIAIATTGAGLALTLTLTVLVFVLATGRSRAESKVISATTELREAEKRAMDEATLLGGVMASISDGVGVVNEKGEFLLHNPAARDLLGIQDDQNNPEEWQEHYGLFLPDGVTPFPVADLPLSRALDGEPSDNVEMIVRNAARPEGVLISVNGRPLDDSTGRRAAVAVFRDITDLRRHQNELQSFAGVVAHDLKSPLTIVGGYSEILDEYLESQLDPPSYEKALATIKRIRGGVSRMQHLIDDLLVYTAAREAPLNFTAVDLQATAEDVIAGRVLKHDDMSDLLAPHIYVGSLPTVEADPVLLRQVLDNLIGNAIKYSQPGRAAHIDVTSTVNNGWARIEVADHGIGIPAGQHAAIFGGFHRAHTSNAYEGTGLGLAICQRAILRHGGKIGVVDNAGGGSRFYFTVPLAESALTSNTPPAPELSAVD